jgi:hypothetical protein
MMRKILVVFFDGPGDDNEFRSDLADDDLLRHMGILDISARPAVYFRRCRKKGLVSKNFPAEKDMEP